MRAQNTSGSLSPGRGRDQSARSSQSSGQEATVLGRGCEVWREVTPGGSKALMQKPGLQAGAEGLSRWLVVGKRRSAGCRVSIGQGKGCRWGSSVVCKEMDGRLH